VTGPRRELVAIVRPPTDALARCELTHIARQPIDLQRARAQHAGYVATLARLGADVIALPAEPEQPDAVFVEDVAVVLDEVAVTTRPGAPSRQAEIPAVADALRAFRPLRHLRPPATLDGGDVIVMDRELLVGRSTRSSEAGIAQLADAVGPFGYTVRGVPIGGVLHLKSAATHLGDGVVLANPAWVDPDHLRARRVIDVDPDEPAAANTFRVGAALVMAHGSPRTTARLTAAGFAPVTVELSELQKAEAAGSCMSIVFRRHLAPGRTEA
jgi:dimethylargininase